MLGHLIIAYLLCACFSIAFFSMSEISLSFLAKLILKTVSNFAILVLLLYFVQAHIVVLLCSIVGSRNLSLVARHRRALGLDAAYSLLRRLDYLRFTAVDYTWELSFLAFLGSSDTLEVDILGLQIGPSMWSLSYGCIGLWDNCSSILFLNS